MTVGWFDRQEGCMEEGRVLQRDGSHWCDGTQAGVMLCDHDQMTITSNTSTTNVTAAGAAAFINTTQTVAVCSCFNFHSTFLNPTEKKVFFCNWINLLKIISEIK